MLIIGRKPNESIVIQTESGETLEITVTEIGNQVRLGIQAPNSMKIWRKELYQTIQQNKQSVEKVPNLRALLLLAKQQGQQSLSRGGSEQKSSELRSEQKDTQ